MAEPPKNLRTSNHLPRQISLWTIPWTRQALERQPTPRHILLALRRRSRRSRRDVDGAEETRTKARTPPPSWRTCSNTNLWLLNTVEECRRGSGPENFIRDGGVCIERAPSSDIPILNLFTDRTKRVPNRLSWAVENEAVGSLFPKVFLDRNLIVTKSTYFLVW